MKYIAVLDTDEIEDFAFFEDGKEKYLHGIDANSVNGEWIYLPFKPLEQEPFKPMVEIDLDYVIKQKYIEREVLDDIRAEVEAEKLEDSPNFCIKAHNIAVDRVLWIIDQYKAETEEDFIDECKRLDGDCDKCTHKYHCCSSERNGRH